MVRFNPTFFVVCLLLAVQVSADDIEIYLGNETSEAVPYVHLLLDYRPASFRTLCNYGPANTCAPPFMSPGAYDHLEGHVEGDTVSRFEVFVAVLETLLENPLYEHVRLSLAVSNFSDGGTILAGYQTADGQGSGNGAVITTLKAIPVAANELSAHPFQPKESYFEWLSYLNGLAVTNGRRTASNFNARDNDTPVPDYDASIMSGTDYRPPFADAEGCSKLFSILWALDEPTQDDSLDIALKDRLGIPGSGELQFEELLHKMHQGDRDLIPDSLAGANSLEKTWVISQADNADAANVWARAGGGGLYLDIDHPLQLEKSLTTALIEVVSVSSAMVSASAAFNVSGQSGVLDDLYIALFEARPTVRWPGNVKKLRRVESGGAASPQIVDASGKPAFATTGDASGRLRFDALTFWTDAAMLPAIDDKLSPAGADGAVVARGGAGQNIPGFKNDGIRLLGDANSELDARQLFVEPEGIVNGGSNTLMPFDANVIGPDSPAAALQSALGVSTIAEAEELIRWGRGQDVDDDDGDGDTTEARSWIMADAMHSKPAVLNYGAVDGYSQSNPNVRLFLGTGDGIFHGIENTSAAGAQSGTEVFGFYPTEGLANIALRRADVVSSLKMRYGVDGTPVVFVADNNHDGIIDASPPFNDEAYVYFGMRRGGYSYYALDVSRPEGAPTLLWKISRTNGGQFDELGLSFSTPLVGTVKYGGEQVDALIFAGGYHGGWDISYSNRIGKDLNAGDDIMSGVSTGNAVYIVNARSGALIWKAVYGSNTDTGTTSSNTRFEHAGLVDSIPSAVTALKTPGGNIHRLYVGDTGGAVWRVDLPVGEDSSDSDHRKKNWFISKLAELGTDGLTSDRRFFHQPDLIEAKEDSGEAFDGLLISSGNRADPLGTDVVNYHFYLKDSIISSGHPAARLRVPLVVSDLSDRTACVSGDEQTPGNDCELPLDNGWMIKMSRPGEKGLATPLVDGGRVFFTSYVPARSGGCMPDEGQSFLSLVNLADGSAVNRESRIYPLGPGLSSGVITLGDQLLTPLGGIDSSDCEGKLCDSYAERMQQIYWREPGVDEQ